MAAGSTSITYDNYSLKVGSTPAILAKQLIFANWALILFGGSVTGIITMFLMHRISGPFYRFELTLKKMAEGDFTDKITLRKHDEGKDIASRINEINRLISSRISEIRVITETSGEALKKIRQESGNNESMEILAENINKTKELIEFFRTDQFK
jgi:methyl-accepting chemotaxis protein